MKLFLVHCGFYDEKLSNGIYENHTNFFLAAENFEDARNNAKQLAEFKNHRMHVDGILQLEAVNGFDIKLESNVGLNGQSKITSFKHRDLAPKPSV